MTETAAVKIPERWLIRYNMSQESGRMGLFHEFRACIEELGAAEAERDALRIQVQDLLGNEVQNVSLQAQNRELWDALMQIQWIMRSSAWLDDLERIGPIVNEALAKVTSPPVTK